MALIRFRTFVLALAKAYLRDPVEPLIMSGLEQSFNTVFSRIGLKQKPCHIDVTINDQKSALCHAPVEHSNAITATCLSCKIIGTVTPLSLSSYLLYLTWIKPSFHLASQHRFRLRLAAIFFTAGKTKLYCFQ
jgi:hypothetical protein